MDAVGRYALLRRLGAGGMGEVFLANDGQLDRLVALKRLAVGDAPEAHRLALKEARVVARLTHPHIAQLHDVVEQDGVVHLVMEFIEGQTLAAAIARSALSEGEVRQIGAQVADALAFAHQHGVVHCDVKPANVMLTGNGAAKLLDFGIAQIERTTGAATGTTTGAVVRGTPPYTAPEVMLGAVPTPRSDVFSLGVTMFEALTGRRPFEGDDRARQLTPGVEPPSVRQYVPGVSSHLSAVVRRAMAAAPDARQASAADLRDALAGRRPQRRVWWPWTAPATAAATALAALVLAAVVRLNVSAPPVIAAPAVVGVLVSNLTGDSGRDHLAAGLSETLVTRLAGLIGIAVVPSGSTAPYIGRQDAVAVATRELGLTHVVVAALQGAPAALRFTVNLIGHDGRVQSGMTVDGSEDRLLEFQQGASNAMLTILHARGLVGPEGNVSVSPPTVSEEAFEQWSHGRAMLARQDVPGSVDRAVRFFERAIQLDAKFGWAHASLGEACWRQYVATRDQAWVARARQALERAQGLAPDDATVLYSLAVVEQGTGQGEAALDHLRAALERQPSNDAAYRLRARILQGRGDIDGAIASIREAARLRHDDPATVRALGLAYFAGGRSDDAIATFTRLTALQPDNAAAFQMLGTAYHAAGELERALVAYERANAIAPQATAYSNIGTIHYARGAFDLAVASYRRAIAIQPNMAATHRNLAESLAGAGLVRDAEHEYATAIALARDALRINPADARSHALVGLCEARLGHRAEAQRAIDEALRLAATDSEIVYKAALIEAAAGHADSAARHLGRALGLGYSAALARTDRDLAQLRARPDVIALLGRP